MNPGEAINLIKPAFENLQAPMLWADLGCGSGTFTKALMEVLPKGSELFAIDKQAQTFPNEINQTKITFQKADFENDPLSLPLLDGILIANALHYVKDKIPFLLKLKNHLVKPGKLIIIEYDTEASNPWVPYPISFNNLKNIISQASFSSIEKMAEAKSIYNNGKIYSCLIN